MNNIKLVNMEGKRPWVESPRMVLTTQFGTTETVCAVRNADLNIAAFARITNEDQLKEWEGFLVKYAIIPDIERVNF